MLKISRAALLVLSFFMWATCAIVVASVSGCASGNSNATASGEVFTESDEPETRKRATNRLRLAVLYFTDGKTTIALDEVKQAIAADPNWFESYNMRGLIYMRLNDFQLASASFQKALVISPGSAEVKHNYGLLLCKNGKGPEALKMFGAALDTPGYSRRPNTLVELGVCQLSMGQTSDAEASFAKSYALDAANPVSGYHLANLMYQRGDVTRAQFYARRLNNSEQASPESLWLGIKIERKLDNRDALMQLGGQLKKRFAQSKEAQALERGAFDE
jgi:type IV pilus assembly protein PilF